MAAHDMARDAAHDAAGPGPAGAGPAGSISVGIVGGGIGGLTAALSRAGRPGG
jgi:hypothetical protein